jgi:hypothetical protein
MSVINQNLLLTPEGYQISRSVRLRSSASAYFNRTLTTPTNNTTWSWSGWVKLGQLGTTRQLFGGASTNYGCFGFESTDQLKFWNNAGTAVAGSTAVYRDPSAWYHVVVISNGTTIKAYVNNSEVLSYTGTITNINSAITHQIGRFGGLSYYTDGYLTEINFIDGQALTPSSFGETDAVTGVWKPKKYTGTYGTNGFYLNFSDNSAATAAAIGKDYSGNGNNWTPNNISVTAGVTYDSMLDVPTMWADGGNGRGNYAVLNPLDQGSGTSQFIKEGNLLLETGSTGYSGTRCTIAAPSTGKWYWEVTQNVITGGMSIGIASANADRPVVTGESSTSHGYQNDGAKRTNLATASYGASYTTNDVIGVALDMDAGTLTFYKNNTSQGTAFSSLSGSFMPMLSDLSNSQSSSAYINFGQRPFAYTPPTGFKALNTQNLPDATIKKGNQYFDATTYTGNHSTNAIVNSGGFQPDLIWLKDRTAVAAHVLFDSVRGVGGFLSTNNTTAEDTTQNYAKLNSFNSNGFTLGASTLANDLPNYSGDSFVGWQWKESVSAGFDIVTYTGNGSARTIAHSLGVKPSMIIIKNRSGAYDWPTWHQNLPNPTTQHFWLNATNGAQTSGSFNSTQPTSSVFSVGTTNEANANGNNFVAYLFAEVAGYSKFGSYTGNGSTDGPFVYLGFRPRWIMLKPTVGTGSWIILDTARDTYNVEGNLLFPNESTAETASPPRIDALSNGFKARAGAGSSPNVSGEIYIYAAFAENPFKNSLAR